MQFVRDLVDDLGLSGRFGNLLKQSEPDHLEQETSLYKRDILRLMTVFKEERPDEEVIDALTKIGHAIYLGGSQSAKLGLSLLPRMVSMCRSPNSSTNLKIQVLKTLSEICSQYKDYQNRVMEQGGLTMLLDMATESGHDELSNWAYYCLSVMLASNIPIMREMQRMPNIGPRITRSMHHYSKGQKVHAETVLRLLGLESKETSFHGAPGLQSRWNRKK